MYHERVKYYLLSSVFDRRIEIEALENWNEDEKELSRSSENYGVFTKMSGDVSFTGKGAEIIEDIYEQYGTEVDLSLQRWVNAGMDAGFELDYVIDIDLKTYSNDGLRVKVEFLSGGIQSLIESQRTEKYELERTTDIKGNEISNLNYETLNFIGRRIFLESFTETPEDNEGVVIQMYGQGFNPEGYRAVPLQLVYESDDNFSGQTSTTYSSRPENATAGDFFYISERQAVRNWDINLKFDITEISGQLYNQTRVYVKLGFWQINGDSTYTYLTDEELTFYTIDFYYPDFQQTTIEVKETITKDLGENIAVGLFFETYASQSTNGTTIVDVVFENIVSSIKQSENSEFPATQCKILRTYDAGVRLMEILTGKKRGFKSSVFGAVSDGYQQNGKWERTALTSGKHIRNLEDAKIALSFNEIFGLNNYFNLGWGIEDNFLVVEEKDYFFQNRVFLDLGEVSDLTISAAEDYLFKSMTFGNEKAGDYEEIHGLQEVNAKTTYQSYLSTADEEYNVTGDIRADLVGMEIARRKQFQNAPNEDTPYDKENFILHLDHDNMELRKWWVDFRSEPDIYDPDSAGNLMLTPFRSMERHSSWFNAGLTKNMDRFTRYSNGTGKTDVVTWLRGDLEPRAENGNIQNSDLLKPIIQAEYYEFTSPVTHEINKLLDGYTIIDDRKVPNTNLLVKFAYRGKTRYGWIVNLKLNDPGQWKLLKQNV